MFYYNYYGETRDGERLLGCTVGCYTDFDRICSVRGCEFDIETIVISADAVYSYPRYIFLDEQRRLNCFTENIKYGIIYTERLTM